MDNRHTSDDNLGSCGSVDEAKTPDDDSESLNQSLSSPGCLSGLSSLQSPSTSLASPLNLLASPATPTAFNDHQALEQTMNHLNNLRKSAAVSHNTLENGGGNGSTFDDTNRDTSSSGAEDKCRTSNSNNKATVTLASNTATGNNHLISSSMTASSSSLSVGASSGSSHASSSAINVPEKHNPPDFYDRLGIIKPPLSSSSLSISANPRDISNPQHPQHPLNINQLTRRDFSSNGSPIFQRKGYPPLHPPPPASMVSSSPSLSPLMPTFSSSPPNQYHLHRQFLESNHFQAAAAAAAARHSALQSLHLQSALGAAAHNAALSAANSLPRPGSTSGNSTATSTSHRPSDSADKGAISVT